MKLVHTLYEPAGDGPHPTIIAFHGWGANAFDLVGLAPYIAEGHFMVICPQGPLEVPIGAIRGYGWYPIRMGSQPDERQVEAAAEEATKFVDDAVARYPVNQRKLVLLGFSQGGGMAYRIAMSNPARFAALVGIATWFSPEFKEKVADRDALKQLPTLVQHGRADDMIEFSRARQSIEHMRELGIPVQFKDYDCGHEITASGIEDLSEFLTKKVLSPLVTV